MRSLLLCVLAFSSTHTDATRHPPHRIISMRSPTYNSFQQNFKASLTASIVSLSIISSSVLSPLSISPAQAADTVAVGKCLIKNCQKELAQCILNPKCLANVICLNTCNGKADEPACQIKCGDLFENDVVGTFNSCAVSQKKCVPQKQNEGEYPLPAKVSKLLSYYNRKVTQLSYYHCRIISAA